jgi:adenosine kinase
MPMFDGDDLLTFIEQATWITVNDYESQLLQERTGLSPHEIAERVEALIVTRGAKGSHIYTQEKRLEIPPAKADQLVDPTGCGDAYRGGLLYGLMNDMDWEVCARIAGLMGATKIQNHGTQNYDFSMDEFKDRFKGAFGFCI